MHQNTPNYNSHIRFGLVWSLGGVLCGVPPWGGPPEAPEDPPGVLGCHRVLGKIVKIPKNYIANLHVSKYPKL